MMCIPGRHRLYRLPDKMDICPHIRLFSAPGTPNEHRSHSLKGESNPLFSEMTIGVYERAIKDTVPGRILSSRRWILNEPRNLPIFLVRRLTGEKPEKIWGQFVLAKYRSVTSATAIKGDRSADRKLRVRVKNIEKTLYDSRPLFHSQKTTLYNFREYW